jgi:NADH-quinone oxidoreductase subunit M
VLAASGVIVAAVYLLWMFRRVMFGALDKEENRKVTDLTRNEIWVMIPLVLLMFYMGFNAGPFLKQIDNSSVVILKHIPGAGSTVRHSSGDATTAPTPVAENAH